MNKFNKDMVHTMIDWKAVRDCNNVDYIVYDKDGNITMRATKDELENMNFKEIDG